MQPQGTSPQLPARSADIGRVSVQTSDSSPAERPYALDSPQIGPGPCRRSCFRWDREQQDHLISEEAFWDCCPVYLALKPPGWPGS